MANVKIDVEEYARLVRIENNYWMILSALAEAMKLNKGSYDSGYTYFTENFDFDTIKNALHLIEGDSFESLYQKKLAEAEAIFAEREEEKARKKQEEEDVSE